MSIGWHWMPSTIYKPHDGLLCHLPPTFTAPLLFMTNRGDKSRSGDCNRSIGGSATGDWFHTLMVEDVVLRDAADVAL